MSEAFAGGSVGWEIQNQDDSERQFVDLEDEGVRRW